MCRIDVGERVGGSCGKLWLKDKKICWWSVDGQETQSSIPHRADAQPLCNKQCDKFRHTIDFECGLELVGVGSSALLVSVHCAVCASYFVLLPVICVPVWDGYGWAWPVENQENTMLLMFTENAKKVYFT